MLTRDCSVLCTVPTREISVDRVRLLYGPVAGGTQITITGQYVNANTVRAVYFGQHKGHIDTNKLPFSLFIQNTLPKRLIIFSSKTLF